VFFRAVETAGAMLTGHLSRFSTGDCSHNIKTQLCRSGNVCSVHCHHAFLIVTRSQSTIVEKFESMWGGTNSTKLEYLGAATRTVQSYVAKKLRQITADSDTEEHVADCSTQHHRVA